MRIVYSADGRPCYACRAWSDVVVGQGHRTTYSCWEHADALLEHGGVIIGQGLGDRRTRSAR